MRRLAALLGRHSGWYAATCVACKARFDFPLDPALLHAGLINAGGFLVLRFADVMAPSASAGMLLLVIGGVTALFGSIVMLTQTSIKVSLAYSTIGQMGFMLFQCGLGAYPIALLHIVAHSLYKAHAFLSSGSVVDLARASWVPAAGTRRAATLAIARWISAVTRASRTSASTTRRTPSSAAARSG